MTSTRGSQAKHSHSWRQAQCMNLPGLGWPNAPCPCTWRTSSCCGLSSRSVPNHPNKVVSWNVCTPLQVSSITLVPTDHVKDFSRRIAVNNTYICYALRAGQVRVLHRRTNSRALLKGALKPADLRCVQPCAFTGC